MAGWLYHFRNEKSSGPRSHRGAVKDEWFGGVFGVTGPEARRQQESEAKVLQQIHKEFSRRFCGHNY
jgi:hypothetical protein